MIINTCNYKGYSISLRIDLSKSVVVFPNTCIIIYNMMMCIGYKSSWGVEMRKNQQRKDTLVEDVQRPTPSPSQLVFRVLFTIY